ncbi:hypothetical protein BGW37DRAFT_522302 [Umbelopsis sp. PMI_123]|nr:hypothetical protein BGW37DRAFT_522302 [Umbelopsis sp. PMI_123]
MESRKRRNFSLPKVLSSYESKAPPFAIRQPGNEPHSPSRTTTYEPHIFNNDNNDIDNMNTTVSEAGFQSPLNDSLISNSFHGFTSPASRASLNSNYFRRRSHRRYSPPSYYKSPSRLSIRPMETTRTPSPPPEHSISVPVMIPIPETTPSRVQTMISRFQTAVDYGISPSLFPEPEDDTYDFFEKIETPDGPRVVDMRKRVIHTTSNVPQKRRRLQVDSSNRFSSRASLHIQPPTFLPKTTPTPTSPPMYNQLPARSPTSVRRPPPVHRPPPSHSPTPVRVLRDISDYTKYGETLLNRQPEEEIQQHIDLQEEEEDIPSPVFSPSPIASPPPIHRQPAASPPPHDRVLRDITKTKQKEAAIAEVTDTIPSHVDRKGKRTAIIDVNDEVPEIDIPHIQKVDAQAAAFENDEIIQRSPQIEKEPSLPSYATEDRMHKTIAAERRMTGPVFDQAESQELDRLLMEQDREEQVEQEQIQEKENVIPADNTSDQKDAVDAHPIHQDMSETEAAQEEEKEEEEVFTTDFDDDEREMDKLFLDEVEGIPTPYKQDDDDHLMSPMEKQRSPSPDLEEQPHVVEEDQNIEEVQPRRSSTPSQMLEAVSDSKDNKTPPGNEANIDSQHEDLLEAEHVDIVISDEEPHSAISPLEITDVNHGKENDKETSQIISPVENEPRLSSSSPIMDSQKHGTTITERRESYPVSDHEEEQTLDQILMNHRRDEHIAEDIQDQQLLEDHIQDKYLEKDQIQKEAVEEEGIQDELHQNESIPGAVISDKENADSLYGAGNQDDIEEAEPIQPISTDIQPTNEVEVGATIVDEEEQKLDMTLLEEVEGLSASYEDDEASQPRSPLVEERSLSPEPYEQEHKKNVQPRPSPSPSVDHEEQALDQLLMQEVDAFGSAESMASLEKENKAIVSPEPSLYETRTPSPVQEMRYHERLQSGYTGQPRSALEVIKDTLTQNQLPTPPRSSPNVSVTKGQDVLLKKMEATDLNRSVAQLRSSYTSTRQNRAEPRRETNEMDVVSEAIGQVMAPYQTSEQDNAVKAALKRFRRSMFDQLSQQACIM